MKTENDIATTLIWGIVVVVCVGSIMVSSVEMNARNNITRLCAEKLSTNSSAAQILECSKGDTTAR